ncbi:MAG: hypothetical protein WCQ00_02130 [bacterium]
MKLIILPGNSKSNREWADKAALAFSNEFEDIYRQYYSHWEGDDADINFEIELDKLVDNLGSDDYIIFAKSVGIIVTLYGIFRGKIKPKKCVFVGFPINMALKEGFNVTSWLREFKIPTVLIQNSNDPITSFDDLKNYLEPLNKTNIELIELEGDNHKYDDFELIKSKTLTFL